MLETVGLKPIEERVYWTLVRMPAASPGELAQRLDLPTEQSRTCLRGLESKGLVSRSPEDPQRFHAAPPDLAFGPLLLRRQQELRSIEAAVGQMADEYRSRVTPPGQRTPVETVYGGRTLRHLFAQLSAGATGQACGFIAECVDVDLAQWPAQTRVVYPRQALDLPGDPYRMVESLRGGAHVRLAPQPPITMLIVDGSAAIVALRPERGSAEEPGALVVHGGALLHALAALFEAVWEAAVPVLVPAPGRPPTDTGAGGPAADDRHLLSLLIAGLTDEAIASKMGLSRRTVQRRVRGLIELAGVQTRLQLAWQSARRGWI